jgi:hypothetical protein
MGEGEARVKSGHAKKAAHEQDKARKERDQARKHEEKAVRHELRPGDEDKALHEHDEAKHHEDQARKHENKALHGELAEPEEIEREVEQIRENLEPVLHELDIRRQELMDWRLQLRRHGPTLLKIGAMAAGAIAMVGAARDITGRMSARRRRRRVARGGGFSY